VRPIRVLIVDDEPLARENLRIRLGERADFRIVGECANGQEAVATITTSEPELLFIDIQMPDLNGFEVIERIAPEILPVIVFVTAYDRYALEAFRVHALDYLLKPFDDDRFAECLALASQRVHEARKTVPPEQPLFTLATGPSADRAVSSGTTALSPYLGRLVIKTRGRVLFLKTDTIDWIEANGDYSRLHAGGKSYLLRKSMTLLAERLDSDCFARVSRSTIINLDRVRELEPCPRGEFLIRLYDGQELKLTRTYRQHLESLLGDKL